MAEIHVVVLAAGKGTRMKSETAKVLHKVAGLALIDRVLRTSAALDPASTTVVIGHAADEVKEHLSAAIGIAFATQVDQRGTGHALLQTRPFLEHRQGIVILLSGDVPLLRAVTVRALIDTHREAQAAATVVTATVVRPFGYGRIVRTGGRMTRIVEERDATPAQRKIAEINSGMYAFELESLFGALDEIQPANAQGEFYLPDLIGIYRKRKRPVATFTVADAEEIRGVNSRSELAEVTKMVRQQKNEELMAAGVTLIDPATTYIDADVEVGADTVIHPFVILEGHTKVGAACEIHAGVRIVNS